MLRPVYFFWFTFIYIIYNFYFINPRHPLQILVSGEHLVFCFFDGVMYTYTYRRKKNFLKMNLIVRKLSSNTSLSVA